ncbi:uncharacterized protein LOC135163309 [Diachasmimorpha longicaudata]|uniref:uncharacterized protein LOC135163309 n=1 Tax=Diachasmimorpha longicaudata TaxID=58733 RepID=UPI0030B890CB
MDKGGNEISRDSWESFTMYDDTGAVSDSDEMDDDSSEVTSNSSSFHQEYSRESNSDDEDNVSVSTDSSAEQLGEILEENNNDPNNNMEGGEEDQAEDIRPIVERPVSPQPGCSKDFNCNENPVRRNADIHKAAIRLKTFLNNISYYHIVSALREKPNLEHEIIRLLTKSNNEPSLKRSHSDDDICNIETKRLTVHVPSVRPRHNEMEHVFRSPTPEVVLDGEPEVNNRAQELTPPRVEGHGSVNYYRNSAPIRIDSSDDDDTVMPGLSSRIPASWMLPVKRTSYTNGPGPSSVPSPSQTKDSRSTDHSMSWKSVRPSYECTRVAGRALRGARLLSDLNPAPATIVREEQATVKTAPKSMAPKPINMKRSIVRGIPGPAGSSQTRVGVDHSPIIAGQALANDAPMKIKILRNGNNSHVIPARRYPLSIPQDATMNLNRQGSGALQYRSSFHIPQPAGEPVPGPSITLDRQAQLRRELQEADREIRDRINYCMRQEAEKQRAQCDGVLPQAPPVKPRSTDNYSRRLPMTYEEETAEAVSSLIPLIHVDGALDSFPSPKQNDVYCLEIYTKLRAMFPNIKKGYIKRITPIDWTPNIPHDVQFGQIVERLLANEDSWELDTAMDEPQELQGTAREARTVDDTYEHLLEIFPDADPTFLRDTAEDTHNDHQALEAFIEKSLKSPTYPTREQYLSKMRITEEQLLYTSNFTVPAFLEKFPDPFKHFIDASRKCKHNTVGFEFLKSQFNRIKVVTVSKVYSDAQWNLSIAAARLKKIGVDMSSSRKSYEIPTEDINMLQEMAFILHQNEIKKYIDDRKQVEEAEFKKLKNANRLVECQCCFDNECMPSKCSSCDQGHIFCNACIIKGTDTRLGDGDTHVPCFQDCGSEFSLATLQKILKPTKFSILVKKRQAAEVAAAGLEGLVSCPFCPFASIPPEGYKVFKCLNPECMKESCIQCKEPNHVPLKCSEVGKADKARKYIEEKMTEALARKCYNCKKAYFKEEGCNKITCHCGAIMCYLCDKKITDYNHFRGQGCDDMTKCPLYSDNAVLNAETVRRVANEARIELLRQDPSLNIETDHLLPTVPPPSAGPHQQILQAPHFIPQRAHRLHIVHAHHRRLPAHLQPHFHNHP